ncbi:MAG TPA: hypothetical protein VFC78_19110 [Tepidisphaeraceae bacterium]|nr:hypothetical protein [Tepidisphaeraceae bacterium]
MPAPGPFIVADLNVRGELQLKADYRYEQLEQIEGSVPIIAHLSAHLWKTPEEFETTLPGGRSDMRLRWRSSAPTAGIATLRSDGQLASLSLLATGIDPDADSITLHAFQRHLLREWHDTGTEPAFALLNLDQRPLIATINFQSPAAPGDQFLVALADRCFAAAYFRFHQLA